MKQILKLSSLTLTALLLFSCEKYLEHVPDMRTEINTVDKVAKLVGSAYPGYGFHAMAETYSDNVCDKGPTSEANLIAEYADLYFWKDLAGSGSNTPTEYWNACYEAIASANQALESIERYNFDSSVLPYKGEALVARAYAHFMLVTFFAKAYVIGGENSSPGIPYVDEPETVAIKTYSRGTVKSVYDRIENDLTEGIALLQGGTWQVPKYHFTPSAAHAFAARFFLFKGDWDKAIDHANQVFTDGDYRGNTRPEATTLKDMASAIRTAEYTKADKSYNLLIAQTRSLYQRQAAGYYSRYGIGRSVYVEDFGKATVAGAAFRWNGGSYRSSLHYWPQKYGEFWYVTNAASNTGYAYIMVPLLTADEALINRAEAYVRKKNYTQALVDINLFASTRIESYNPANHTVTTAKAKAYFNLEADQDEEALIRTILQFKKIAFLSEGIRWLDIVRHRIPVVHNFIAPDGTETFQTLGPDDNRRMFQLPQEVTLSGVELNPR